MSIALHTAHVAGGVDLSGGSPGDLASLLHSQLRRQVRVATAISQAMVRPSAQPLLAIAAGLAPFALNLFARATRIPAQALVASGKM